MKEGWGSCDRRLDRASRLKSSQVLAKSLCKKKKKPRQEKKKECGKK
jgi:hypothetical protein